MLSLCKGVVACAIGLPRLGKLMLFSNNGSLYLGSTPPGQVFASERYPLDQIGAEDIVQVRSRWCSTFPSRTTKSPCRSGSTSEHDLVPPLGVLGSEERLLVFPEPDLRRCTRCILPETMPYIRFDADGVCNYCLHYKPRNNPRPKEELFDLVEPYRRADGNDCIVPFSGGRDSCYGLHLIVNELKMKPVTYTYDWGMVTDLGRRNISRMCAELGVENIIVAADIQQEAREHRARTSGLAEVAAPRDGQHPHGGRQALLPARRDDEDARPASGSTSGASTRSRSPTSRPASSACRRTSRRSASTATER